MGHVDDTHDTEGDGQPDGGQNQDGAEAQAEKNMLYELEAAGACFDARDGLARGLPHILVVRLGNQAGELGADVGREIRVQEGDRSEYRRWVGAVEVEQRQCGIDGGDDLIERLGVAQAPQCLCHRLVTGDTHGFDSRHSGVDIRIVELQLSDQPAQGAAQSIVHADLGDVPAADVTEVLAGQSVQEVKAPVGLRGDDDLVGILVAVELTVHERAQNDTGAVVAHRD